MSIRSPDAQFLKKSGGSATGLTVTGGVENQTTLTSATTITIDMDEGPLHNLEDQAHNTTLALDNEADGKSASVRLEQDSTGGRTIAVPAGWIALDGAPTWSTTANKVNWLEVWQAGGEVFYKGGVEG